MGQRILCALVLIAAAASAQTTYLNGSYTFEGAVNYCGSDTGTVNAYVCANPAGAIIGAYRVGNTYSFKASHANTGAATLRIDGLTTVAIKKQQGAADLVANDIIAGAIVRVAYDGTYFELETETANSPATGGGGTTSAAWGSITGILNNQTDLATALSGKQASIPANTYDAFGAATTAQSASLQKSANLSDLANTATARTNLGLGSAATQASTAFDISGAASTVQSSSLQKSSNLSDVTNVATARTSLGLGSAATQNTTAFDAAGAASTAQSASLQKSANLSDVANATTALSNLGGVTSAQASSAAPVQSVAGRIGAVTLTHTDITDWTSATSGFAGGSSGSYTPLNGFTRSIEGKLQEYYSVTDYGAVPDGVMRTDGAMNAGSAVLTSASGSFASGDVGKYVQVIGAGPGGTTHSDGAMTSGSAVLTSASSSFVALDMGRGIIVLGAGPGGGNLITTINGVNSGTSVTLSATASTSVSGKQFYYGYMTLEGTISSVQSATQATLSASAAGTITGATYAYGTDSHIAIQAAIDRVGALGGGIVRLPTPANCPSGAICGYVAKATDQMTAHVPGAIKIRYSNVSLMGDPNMTNIFCRGAWSNFTNPAMGAGLTEEIRGNCINIGDDGGPLGSGGDNVQNVTVQYLRLYGMTNGMTYNTSFDPTKDPLTTTGDGWDETHKGIYIWGGAGQTNITIANIHAQDFKGETVYSGGGATSITLRDSVITNSNSSCVSISANNFKMLYNTVTNCANAGVENGTMSSTTAPAFENVRHLYQGNIFRNIPSEAIVLVGVDAGINRGVLEVVDNYFDTIGVVHGSGSQVAVYVVAQNNGSNQPPSHVIIDRNVCHDCQSMINIQTTGHAEVKDNSFIVDNYGLYNFMSFMQAMKDVVVTGNTGSITANAIANNHSMYTVYEMDPGYVSGSGAWNRLVIQNNIWDFTGSPAPPTWFQFVTSSAQGYAFATAKFPVWGGDICYGCVEVGDYGVQNISATNVIQPVGPVNTVNGQTSAATVTVSTAKADDGTEIKIVNTGGFALTFANDSNMQLASSVLVPVNGLITLRYEAVIGKFVLR